MVRLIAKEKTAGSPPRRGGDPARSERLVEVRPSGLGPADVVEVVGNILVVEFPSESGLRRHFRGAAGWLILLVDLIPFGLSPRYMVGPAAGVGGADGRVHDIAERGEDGHDVLWTGARLLDCLDGPELGLIEQPSTQLVIRIESQLRDERLCVDAGGIRFRSFHDGPVTVRPCRLPALEDGEGADLDDHENEQADEETRAFHSVPPFISMIAPWLSSRYNNARKRAFQEQ